MVRWISRTKVFLLHQEIRATQPSAVLDHRVNSQTSAGIISRIELRIYVSPLARFRMFMNYCQAVGHKRLKSERLISNVLEHCSRMNEWMNVQNTDWCNGVMVFQAQTWGCHLLERPELQLRVLVSGLSSAWCAQDGTSPWGTSSKHCLSNQLFLIQDSTKCELSGVREMMKHGEL